ncbi:MBL fold metallo-hydrolase [Microbacteriaceae bacterium VKM Ac-2854]|nr:MBL fold metallo-hydrolase [Microbacteriaceae bacterium VKM Ac-2854]
MGWIEVARGVYHRRYEPVDVSVGVILGPQGVVVVDTRNNPREGREILADVARDFDEPVRAVINTHAHYDHTFGNAAFVGLPIFGHALTAAHYGVYEAPRLARVQADPGLEPDKDWADVELIPPTELVDTEVTIAPAGREIRLIPLPPGHTDTDLAVLVPDARVWFLGDVIEESGPPMFGSGSFPLDWPDVLAGLGARIRAGDVVVPGHGAAVDRSFVLRQAEALRTVAAHIRSAYGAGDAIEAALEGHGLPWPTEFLRSALERGFAQLDADA